MLDASPLTGPLSPARVSLRPLASARVSPTRVWLRPLSLARGPLARRSPGLLALALLALALAAPAAGCASAAAPRDVAGVAPEAASGLRAVVAVRAQRQMVVTANQHATRAGLAMLRAGGSAVDAAIAAQAVLGLTEPQSSGFGGGALLVLWDAASRQVTTYDGRETAPAAMDPAAFRRPDGAPLDYLDAIVNGASVGTPGVLRALELAHQRHGKLPWRQLFEPAIALAAQGFAVSPRLHALLAQDPALPKNPAARATFYGPDGGAWPVGHVLANPALAEVLRAVADGGADALYRGPIAAAMVAAVRDHARPGALSLADLAGYRAKERPPVCMDYRATTVCGMGPPTSGGLTVLQILGLLEPFALGGTRPLTPRFVHLFAEASRLAYADRGRYIGDPDFAAVPTRRLLDKAYLQRRATLIDEGRSMGVAQPGAWPARGAAAPPPDRPLDMPSTSHLSIVDAAGNALSMTTTIESAFGSRILVRGFLLNNQLTDFNWFTEQPAPDHPNAIAPGKRPRSSMAPTLVLDRASGAPTLVLGSPGGARIIAFVARVLVAVLDQGVPLQAALAAPNLANRNGATELERVPGPAAAAVKALEAALVAKGHQVRFGEMTSGLHAIQITSQGLIGAVDPRREGVAAGD